MRKQLLTKIFATALGVLAWAATGGAQTVTNPCPNRVISWNLDDNSTVNPTDLAGLAPATNWVDTWLDNITTAVPDNSGAATTLNLSWSSFNTWSIEGHPGYDANGTANRELLNGFLNTGYSTWEGAGFVTNNILNFTNVPYAKYDVIVYASDDTSGRHFSMDDGNGQIYYGSTMGSAEVSGTDALFIPATSTNSTSFPQADFVVFLGETSTNLTITQTPKSGADQWTGIAGFQIVQSSNTYIIYGPSPANQIVPVGQPVSFSIIASGLNPAYQWRQNGNPIANATNAIYSITAAALGEDGNYDVVITNSFSSITSAVATLTFYSPKTLTWDGNGSTWDTTSDFWTLNGGVSTTNFTETDNVRFDSHGVAQSSVTLSADLTPSSITVSNATYTLTGNAIAGSGALNLEKAGTLVLDTADNSSGPVTIDNTSTLQVGNNDALGVLGSGALTNNGALNFNLSSAFAYGYPIYGTGAVINSAAAQITLANTVNAGQLIMNAAGGSYLLQGNNNFTSGMIISNGVVLCRSVGCLGAAPVTIYPSGELQFTFITENYVGSSINLAGGLLDDVAGSTFDGPVTLTADSTIEVDAGTLTLPNAAGISGNGHNLTLNGAGTLQVEGTQFTCASLTVSSGTMAFDSTANLLITNPIAGSGNINQNGSGTVIFTGDLSLLTGVTTVSAGTLCSPTTNGGSISVLPGATLEPGTPSTIGTITDNGDLTLGGNLAVKVNKALVQSNDFIVVTGNLSDTNTGTVSVSNLGTALQAGDRFVLFNQAVTGGDTLSITGGGATWSNNLATDGSIIVLSAATIASYSTNLTATFSSGALSLSWPATHLGWILQAQTNSLAVGLSTNWTDVSGSAAVTSTNLPIDQTIPAAFYRLRHP
jgi:autotransporter-associated beta strand protein